MICNPFTQQVLNANPRGDNQHVNPPGSGYASTKERTSVKPHKTGPTRAMGAGGEHGYLSSVASSALSPLDELIAREDEARREAAAKRQKTPEEITHESRQFLSTPRANYQKLREDAEAATSAILSHAANSRLTDEKIAYLLDMNNRAANLHEQAGNNGNELNKRYHGNLARLHRNRVTELLKSRGSSTVFKLAREEDKARQLAAIRRPHKKAIDRPLFKNLPNY